MEQNFLLTWEENGNIQTHNYEFIARMFPHSKINIKKYGTEHTAYIFFDQDIPDIPDIPDIEKNKTIVLQSVYRRPREDKTLSGMGFNLICFSINHLIKKGFKYVLLYATDDDLVAYYNKLGFVSIGEDKKDMIGNIKEILKKCSAKPKDFLPPLLPIF